MSFPSLNQDENFETFFLPLFFINFTIKLNGCKCVKKDDKRICGLVCVSTLIQKMKEQSSMEPPYTGSSIFGLEVYGPSFGPALHQSTSLCHNKMFKLSQSQEESMASSCSVHATPRASIMHTDVLTRQLRSLGKSMRMNVRGHMDWTWIRGPTRFYFQKFENVSSKGFKMEYFWGITTEI